MEKKEMWIQSGAKLKELRKATGMSVFKVGRAIGMSGSYVSQFERGSCAPSEAALIALSDLYGVDKKDLFDLYKKMPNDEVATIMQHPELRQLFLDVTNDKKFDVEKLNKVIEEFKKMASEYENKGE